MKAQAQIEKLKSLQESLHDISEKVLALGDGSVVLNDVAEGKKQIAEAINTKGGNSTPDESFQQLADDILRLNTDGKYILYGLVFNTEINSLLEILSSNSEYIENSIIEINDYEGRIFETSSQFNYPELKKVFFKNLMKINSGGGFLAPKLETIIAPNLIILEYYIVRTTNVRNIEIGTLEKFFIQGFSYQETPYLRNISIGANTNIDIKFSKWTAAYVIAEGQSGIDELNSNLYNNLLTKLYDHSNDGETRTLRLGWLANVTPENIAYANAKGWTLTT